MFQGIKFIPDRMIDDLEIKLDNNPADDPLVNFMHYFNLFTRKPLKFYLKLAFIFIAYGNSRGYLSFDNAPILLNDFFKLYRDSPEKLYPVFLDQKQ